MKNEYKSWSTNQLRLLTAKDNHKIMFDGYEYIWMNKIDGEWKRHCIFNYANRKRAYSHMKYSLSQWDKELIRRVNKYERNQFFKEMEEEFKSQDKIRGIAKSTLPTIEKINFMRLENPHISKYQVCELLDIKASIYYRYLRTLKQRGTLLSA